MPATQPPDSPVSRPRGTLTLLTGPMFAGKSAHLIRAARAAAATDPAGVLALKPAFDTRAPLSRLLSRDESAPETPALPVSSWPHDAARNRTLLILDEVQFLVAPHYDGDVVADIECALLAGSDVLAGGLDTDYHRHPFAVVVRLRERADRHHPLLARCHACGAPAPWTAKKRDTGALLEPGDAELYEARCDRHWTDPPRPPNAPPDRARVSRS
ncbi:MAG: thymidine kinase [Gluconacetobacter diazotrophicus]|nr:thymidine kinase [Gluconacetobacter diazotrophicus]